MSLAVELSLAFETTTADIFRSQPGCLAPAKDTVLFGYCEDFDNQVTHWQRSTNNGQTWTQVADTPGGLHNDAVNAAHGAGGTIIYPCHNGDFLDAQIMRSTNFGSTWTLVDSFNGPTHSPFRTVAAPAITALTRDRFIILGQFGQTSDDPWINQLTSDAGGVNYTEGGQIFDANNGSWGTAIANAGNGRLIAAGTLGTARTYYPKLFYSTDYGVNWTASDSLPLPAGARTITIRAITAVTDQIILAGGLVNTVPFADNPALWRSTDGGATWSLIPASSIASWPSAAVSTDIWELKRLTTNFVAMGLAQPQDDTTPPWRFSLDGGETWPIIPTTTGGGMPPTPEGMGRIVALRNGTIMLPLYARGDPNTSRQVWAGRIVC